MNVKIGDGGLDIWGGGIEQLLRFEEKDDVLKVARETFIITEIYKPLLKVDNSDEVHSIYFEFDKQGYFETHAEERGANAALQIRERDYVRFVYGKFPNPTDRSMDFLHVMVDMRLSFDSIVQRIKKVRMCDVPEETYRDLKKNEVPLELIIGLARMNDRVYIIAQADITRSVKQMIIAASVDLML